MNVLVVLHEATQTGAPVVGGLLATALQRHLDVRVVCLDNGPLAEWLRERVGPANVTFVDSGDVRHRTPFAERVRQAQRVLAAQPCELVYVNSAAASEFVIAAKSLGKTVVLHVHEQAATLRRLMETDLLKYEVLAMSDGVVLAAHGLRKDVEEVFGYLPERCMSFGIALDVAAVERLAREAETPAYNADGAAFGSSGRLVVGMCGTASARKGADIFFEAAAAIPEHDFLWIGPWGSGTDANPSLEDFRRQRLPNLFVTEGVSNPYRYIARLDLFFLSSREDPNPLVISEAMLLGVPVLTFSHTTSVPDFLGRNAILCHGGSNAADAIRVLRALDPDELRSPEFRRIPDGFRERIDMNSNITRLLGFLASVQRR